MSKAITSDARGVHVSGEMTIFSAAELKQPLLAALKPKKGRTGAPDLDLAEVTEFDTAGLQLLLLARQQATRAGRELRVGAASVAVREALALCGAVGLLADAPAGEIVL